MNKTKRSATAIVMCQVTQASAISRPDRAADIPQITAQGESSRKHAGRPEEPLMTAARDPAR